MSFFRSFRFKNRLTLGIFYAGFMSLPLMIGYLYSADQLGPFRWIRLAPSLAALLLPLVWPACPHCRKGIIWPRHAWRIGPLGEKYGPEAQAWIWPPRHCPNCSQELEGPFRTESEFQAYRRDLLESYRREE